MRETREIQSRLRNNPRKSDRSISKEFTKHMLRGNIRAALILLENSTSKGVLDHDTNIKNILRDLHPASTEPRAEALRNEEVIEIDPIVYE